VLARTGAQVPELRGDASRSTAPASRRWSLRWASASPQGLFLPGEGQLDNRALLAALLATLRGQPRASTLHWQSPRAPERLFAPGTHQASPTG
jgi:glycine oxidase